MSRAEENCIDCYTLSDIEFLKNYKDEDCYEDCYGDCYEDCMEEGYWNGTKISDMSEKYLLNAIRYAVKNPPTSAIDCDDWNNKIKELLDEFCDRVKKSDLRTDFDFLG